MVTMTSTSPAIPNRKPWRIGLENHGNTCYISACVQTLLGLPAFVRELVKLGRLFEDGDSSLPLCPVTRATASLCLAYTKQEQLDSRVVELKSVMASFFPQFDGWNMQDASEFISKLLEKLVEEIDQLAEQVGENNLRKLLGSEVRLVRQCVDCDVRQEEKQSNLWLWCDTQPSAQCRPTLQELLQQTVCRVQDRRSCLQCGSKEVITTASLTTAPPVLYILLRRYKPATRREASKQVKLELPDTISLAPLIAGDRYAGQEVSSPEERKTLESENEAIDKEKNGLAHLTEEQQIEYILELSRKTVKEERNSTLQKSLSDSNLGFIPLSLPSSEITADTSPISSLQASPPVDITKLTEEEQVEYSMKLSMKQAYDVETAEKSMLIENSSNSRDDLIKDEDIEMQKALELSLLCENNKSSELLGGARDNVEDNEPQIRLRQRKPKARDENQELVENFIREIKSHEEVSEEDSGSDGEWGMALKKMKKRKGGVDSYMDKREQECVRLISNVNSSTRKSQNTNVTRLKRAKPTNNKNKLKIKESLLDRNESNINETDVKSSVIPKESLGNPALLNVKNILTECDNKGDEKVKVIFEKIESEAGSITNDKVKTGEELGFSEKTEAPSPSEDFKPLSASMAVENLNSKSTNKRKPEQTEFAGQSQTLGVKRTSLSKLSAEEFDTFSNNNLKLPHFPPIHSSNAKYRLHSVISHIGGSARSGHYVADVKHDKFWYRFDDKEVHRSSDKTVRTGDNSLNCYILSYRHCQFEMN